MNRLQNLFKEKNNILSIYYTAGYPSVNDTIPVAVALESAGVDVLEIGFPYSDPVADGPVLQASSKAALDNGMSLEKLFDQLRTLRESVSIPVLLMGYVNPVLQYGVERFCRSCKETGIDGCIIPDLPLEEYCTQYQETFKRFGICPIFLVTPNTSDQRIQAIDKVSDGFIYLLSAAATTGTALALSEQTTAYFKRIAEMKLNNPIVVGFGIGDKKTFDAACVHTNGAIVGTAFVKTLESGFDPDQVSEFIRTIR